MEVPWGAHPSYMAGYYRRDDDFYRKYDAISRSETDLAAYLEAAVYDIADRAHYLATVDTGALEAARTPAQPVNYGFERSQ